ncbi:hypothetical protein [Enterovirga rhinocerotis]|uniref:XRE family transcriptional regulator n=1 Tax=Enterovirga rhinocerotis TaxID=1339210 RepID=A0A4V3DWM8_9HYPH|nr:hypothetical protein [Enterovirga rhinocerotis]TDR85289.1 hypothetical protein EV668_4842 [Enterovirga rhinocerotis]
MSFHKTGRLLHDDGEHFAMMVSRALKDALGYRAASIKQVASWTGAGERTVKNWFAGSCAPRGQHFSALVRHCPGMLDAFLASAGRSDRLAFVDVQEARKRLRRALDALEFDAPPETPPGS